MRSLVAYEENGNDGGIIYFATDAKLCIVSMKGPSVDFQLRDLPSGSEPLAVFAHGTRCAVVQKNKEVSIFSAVDVSYNAKITTVRRVGWNLASCDVLTR